jgi:SAM-dependent methyltransferase
MDIRDHNRSAWNKLVEGNDQWTVPVSPEVIAEARRGEWEILLTDTKPVPRDWFPLIAGLDVLCLASGGGQQAPILAAAGARVTVLDNSPKQLEQDRLVAEREALDLRIVEGDMTDLSQFTDESFDLIFHPISNVFIADVRPVWKEAFRVLRRGGLLLAGFVNPLVFIFDGELEEQGVLEVRHALPYSDVESLSEEERQRRIERGDPLEFGHTLTDQIGGQLDAGFQLTAFYEDRQPRRAIAQYTPIFIATRAVKP